MEFLINLLDPDFAGSSIYGDGLGVSSITQNKRGVVRGGMTIWIKGDHPVSGRCINAYPLIGVDCVKVYYVPVFIERIDYHTITVYRWGLLVVRVAIVSMLVVEYPEPVSVHIRLEAKRTLMDHRQALGVLQPGDHLPGGLVQPSLGHHRVQLGCHNHPHDPENH